jgi:hypothetical protein
MKTRNRRRWGAVIFGGEEGEEMRWLHDAGGERHSKEWWWPRRPKAMAGVWKLKINKGN